MRTRSFMNNSAKLVHISVVFDWRAMTYSASRGPLTITGAAVHGDGDPVVQNTLEGSQGFESTSWVSDWHSKDNIDYENETD